MLGSNGLAPLDFIAMSVGHENFEIYKEIVMKTARQVSMISQRSRKKWVYVMPVMQAGSFAFLAFLPSLPRKARFNQNTFLVESGLGTFFLGRA